MCIQNKPALLLEGLRHGIDTLMTDIDTIYVKNPFDYFSSIHAGEHSLLIQGSCDTSNANLNTGIVFARATKRTMRQARTWAEDTGPGRKTNGHVRMRNDQDVMNGLCNRDPDFNACKRPGEQVCFHPANGRSIQWACLGCGDPMTVVSH